MSALTTRLEKSTLPWVPIARQTRPKTPLSLVPRPLPIVHEAAETPEPLRHGVVLLGNFDDFHKGHQALLARGRLVAKRIGAPLGVMSVEPHPRQFFAPEGKPFRLTSPVTKRLILREQGFDFAYSPNFDADFASLSAEEFVRDVLVRGLRVRHVVVGYDFRFGRGRHGTPELLRHLGRRYEFSVSEVAAQVNDEDAFSSSLVRQLIAAGDIAAANVVLGHKWLLEIMPGSMTAEGGSEWRVQLDPEQLRPAPGGYPVRLVSMTGERRNLGWGRIAFPAEPGSKPCGWARFTGSICLAKHRRAAAAVEFLG